MILVTGGAGFIGSNLVRALISRGERDVWIVDDFREAHGPRGRLINLARLDVPTLDRDALIDAIASQTPRLEGLRAVFHQGACTDTTAPDDVVTRDNYDYSMRLLDFCDRARTRLIYASSAAVYGSGGPGMQHTERPLNAYARSKLRFDEAVRSRPSDVQRVGLRYFNVYGPHEGHKGRMASMALQMRQQLVEGDSVRLFAGTDGFCDGGQRRDFVHVDDVVRVVMWFWDHPHVSGTFDVGTGRASSFNEVARAVLRHFGRGRIEYIPFPDALRGRYQSYTEADLAPLRDVGCDVVFRDVDVGVREYMAWLDKGGAS